MKKIRPILRDDLRRGRFPDYVHWAFSGCEEYCGHDLGKLSVYEQTAVFIESCDACPKSMPEEQRKNSAEWAAAYAMYNLAMEDDWLGLLKLDMEFYKAMMKEGDE